MMNYSINTHQITQIAWALLISHREKDSEPVCLSDLNPRTLSFLDGDPITDDAAQGFLKEWIEHELNSCNRVIIYTCKDNAEICIEDGPTITPEEIRFMEDLDYSDYPELEGILYVSFD